MIYPEVCAWYGSLTVAKLTGNSDLSRRLIGRFDPLLGAEARRISPNAHVDYRVFGAVPLGETKHSRIAYSAAFNWSLVTYGDSFLGRAYRPHQGELEPGFHPLQIAPVSIAPDGRGGRAFYVLESASNTITVIPANADANEPWQSAIDVPALEAPESPERTATRAPAAARTGSRRTVAPSSEVAALDTVSPERIEQLRRGIEEALADAKSVLGILDKHPR